jgi:serine protease
VTIAVLDTGVAYRRFHRTPASPDLQRTRFVAGYDFVKNDPYANDRNGHGTHVTSTIAETANNGIGFTGLAYGARIMPVKVLDDRGEGNSSVIARGVRFAVNHGAQIINMSLDFGPDVTRDQIPELLSAIAYAHRKGVLVVAAAGNDRNSDDGIASANGGPAGTEVAWPARSGDVIAVGATTEHLCLSLFSDTGPGLDIVAPGGGHDDEELPDPGCQPERGRGRDIFQLTLTGSNHTVFRRATRAPRWRFRT